MPHAPVAVAGAAVAASAAADGGGGGDDPLDALFSALSRGAELNPDDSDDGEGGGGSGGGFGGGFGGGDDDAGFASGGFYGDLGGGVMGWRFLLLGVGGVPAARRPHIIETGHAPMRQARPSSLRRSSEKSLYELTSSNFSFFWLLSLINYLL